MSLFNIHYVSLVFLLAAVVVSALPHNVTSTTENVTETKDPVPRQGRAFDVAAMAKTFLTPNNIAQVKSLFGGALSNVLTFNAGNVVVLALLAGTALLIAPTLLALFGVGGALGRSFNGKNSNDKADEAQNTLTVNVYKAIDDFFKQYNIDAATCMQRFACTASRKTANSFREGKPTYLDTMLNYLLSSSYVNSLLGQTKVMEAFDHGKANGDCEIQYGKCPFSWEKVAQYIPFNFNTTPAPTKSVPEANSSENAAH